MTMTDAELRSAVAGEYRALADLLDPLPDADWDTASLCAGWRVREVVAHMTMPVRYSPERFGAELAACGGDFGRLSNTVAERDAALPRAELVANLRDETLHRWEPPGGGMSGALTHVVIHGLDATVPLGVGRLSPDDTIRYLLDTLTRGGTHAHFGVDLTGRAFRATDLDWSYGDGPPVTGTAADIALVICGRQLPPGRLTSP